MNLLWFVIVVVLYVAVLAFLGYKGWKATKSTDDYMVGGRSIPPFVMALSYGAAFISTSAIVGFGGVSSFYGYSMIWLPALNILSGIFIAYIIFGKRTRRMGLNLNAHTFPEFLGKRLDSKFIQGFAGAVIFIFMPLYAAAVLIGASKLIEVFAQIPYIYSVVIFSVLVAVYVIMGGLKGMMYADALQGSLMFLGMLILLFVVLSQVGGFTGGNVALTEIADKMPAAFAGQGMSGWTEAPERFSSAWWLVFSSLVLGVGIGALAQPQLVVKFMTVKSNNDLNKAVLIGGIFIFVVVGTPFVVGPLSNVYFNRVTSHIGTTESGALVNLNDYVITIDEDGNEIDPVISTGLTAFEVSRIGQETYEIMVNSPEEIDFSTISMGAPDADIIIPFIIWDVMPDWFIYIFMLIILSAAISTMSAQFHTIGTAVSRDVVSTITKKSNDTRDILIARIGIALGIIVTVILGMKLGVGVIARATAIFFGLIASSFLAPYAAAIFWKGLTKVGAISGIITGISIEIFMFLFTHAKEAAVFGICEAITGNVTLFAGKLDAVDPMVIALPASALVTIVVSLLTKVHNSDTVEKSFEGIGK